MDRGEGVELAIATMERFAERTGLSSSASPVRYLWTDAFAVCNYVGLYEITGEDRFLSRARALVDQVHVVLGRHREDDPREGWISGLPDARARDHPTVGGLRIGKPRPERTESEPYRPAEEWDRDGQYYHYLTKWVFALHRLGGVQRDAGYRRWAIELARAAHDGFVVSTPAGPRLRWKMSIDLSRPLVASMGQHDALDGLITTSVLLASEEPAPDSAALRTVLPELASMCEGQSWATTDPLGLGGLLVDAFRCAQLAAAGHPTGPRLFGALLVDARASLRRLSGFPFLDLRPERRLAFRELGLALGFQAVDRLERMARLPATDAIEAASLARDLEALARHQPVGTSIVEFWSRPASRTASTWREHRDISDVMWVTSLVPDAFLEI